MWLSFNKLLLLASVSSTTSASPSFVPRDGVDYTVYNHAATGSKLEIVKNSGICETTPGVNQYSGYFSVGQNMSMWFWFFESRNNPKTAPLAAYFEGGPGCSSMLGLFQQNGPCHFVNNKTTPSLNEYSWNNYANMLYFDQPIGSGFSYGDTDAVNSTATASPYVWNFLQVFYENFPEYESREFGLTTESYGGHYGPDFVDYIQQQNDKIDKGTVKGEKIDLVALMINNGWYDSAIQSKAYVDYAYDNPYRQLINESERDSYYNAYYAECLPALNACQIKGTDTACKSASSVCAAAMFNKMIAKQDFSVYDVRAPFNDPNPPATYATYLQDTTIQKAIGARVK
ncbi:hypothetical protein AWENTII_003109 [Aspergillus wentii]|nr:hypothetical protein MW887_007138 [Aspergillus wentii]